jgi:hypothetical protein
MGDLNQEIEFFLSTETELAARYAGQFLVIKDGQVHGAYADALKAIAAAREKGLQTGSFLLQQCCVNRALAAPSNANPDGA